MKILLGAYARTIWSLLYGSDCWRLAKGQDVTELSESDEWKPTAWPDDWANTYKKGVIADFQLLYRKQNITEGGWNVYKKMEYCLNTKKVNPKSVDALYRPVLKYLSLHSENLQTGNF